MTGVRGPPPHSHVSLVVGANLLDPDVILGINERLCGSVGLGEGHHAGNVLEVVVVFHFDLMVEEGREAEREVRVHARSHTHTHTHTLRVTRALGPQAHHDAHTQRQTWVPHLRRSPLLSLPSQGWGATFAAMSTGTVWWPALCLLQEAYLGNTHGFRGAIHIIFASERIHLQLRQKNSPQPGSSKSSHCGLNPRAQRPWPYLAHARVPNQT